ncbi:hypothetical protein L2E82_45657 [Cichorium intybus]|uniref:Uncharacterized protein n=1 Tax=Cichorium intybus TaxID=13427 RepID=A0ACB8ZTM7_CICIN|nr:hypothetical protein L2E82_45657 [Cichorium intybus]
MPREYKVCGFELGWICGVAARISTLPTRVLQAKMMIGHDGLRSIRCAVLSLVGFAELPHGFLHCRLELTSAAGLIWLAVVVPGSDRGTILDGVVLFKRTCCGETQSCRSY